MILFSGISSSDYSPCLFYISYSWGKFYISTSIYFDILFSVLHVSLISSYTIEAHDTDIGVGCTDVRIVAWLVSEDISLKVKNFTGRAWDSNPGPCI